ncbi:hypothetical protein G6F40_017759 [Rhizopus arrhizus]|nr:hypothetical protein G6F40_017759 [Rhizopus arrhizus]
MLTCSGDGGSLQSRLKRLSPNFTGFLKRYRSSGWSSSGLSARTSPRVVTLSCGGVVDTGAVVAAAASAGAAGTGSGTGTACCACARASPTSNRPASSAPCDPRPATAIHPVGCVL